MSETLVQAARALLRDIPFRGVPRLARPHFRMEMSAWMMLSALGGAIEGGVVSVIAKNAYGATVSEGTLNAAVAVLSGAPAFANITSFLWNMANRGRHKIRFLVAMQVAAAVLVGAMTFAPDGAAGLAVLIACSLAGRVCWSGVITLRTAVWRANYPRNVRATMTGRLATVQSLVIAGVGAAIGAAMERSPDAFHLLYPIAAGAGLVGAAFYARIRMRGHAGLIRRERAAPTNGVRGAFAGWSILREDRLFRGYMAAMFILGIGNLAMAPILVIILRDVFGYGYRSGILASTVLPVGLMPLCIPMWSRLLDRVHVVQFRVFHAWTFIGCNALLLVATLRESPVLLWCAVASRSVAFAGGALGWNLGHHDFGHADRTNDYMSIHVTLTGVRGFIGPALAVALYESFPLEPARAAAGVFAICTALNVVGAGAFLHLRRVLRRTT